MREGLYGQFEPGGTTQHTLTVLHFFGYCRVVIDINDDRNALKIFRSRPEHCRPSNIDVFDSSSEITIRFSDCLFKWIKINHKQINGFNPICLHHFCIDTRTIGITSTQQATMNFRVQRLHATLHHLGERRIVRYFLRFNVVFKQKSVSTTCRQQANVKTS